MRLMKSSITVFIVFTLAACASGIDYKHMIATTPKVTLDHGRIYFFRNSNIAGLGVQPSIKLDDVIVGRSKPGGFFYVDSATGMHEISTAADPEQKLAVTLKEGETEYIKTSPGFGDMAGKIKLEVVSEADAMKELPHLVFTGETNW